MRKEYKYLDLSLIEKKYEPMLSNGIDTDTNELIVHNNILDLDLNIFLDDCDITTITIDFIERDGFYTEFNMSELNEKIDKLTIAILVDWFVNLKEIPSYLICEKKPLKKKNHKKGN